MTVEATGVSEVVMMSVNEMEYVGVFGSSGILLPSHLLMKIPSVSKYVDQQKMLAVDYIRKISVSKGVYFLFLCFV